jgi:hypothetical protein
MLYADLSYVSSCFLKRDDKGNCSDPPLPFEYQKEERVSVE